MPGDDTLTTDEIRILIAALTTHAEKIGAPPPYVNRAVSELKDKLQRMHLNAPATKRYMVASLMGSPETCQVCTRCGSVVPNTNEWRMLHDEWHRAVALGEVEV